MQQYADIYFLQSHSFQRGLQATLEGSSCTSIMTCTGDYGYSC